jgi:hypothetical protein
MTGDTTNGDIERRAFIKRAALVAGATVWAAPTIQSLASPAFATGTGTCPPGRTVRFKYDVGANAFDSGAARGGGASWCLPDGYADADISVNGPGNSACVSVGGKTYCITVIISADGKSAQVTIPAGAAIEDLQAKAGSAANGECDDMDYMTQNTAFVQLEDKKISFVAGVLCV